MKKLFFAIALIFITTSFVNAQSKEKVKNTAVPEANFNQLKHSFGEITQNIPATTFFIFENKGKAPLIIETAAASCGCTTPVYPKQPIMPGKKGEIKVTYNAQALGHFVKMVTVKFAQHNRPVNLVIDGDVVTKPTKK